MDVLQLDVSGRPQAWISSREAAVLYASDALAWTLGQAFQVMRGGTQRATGLPSRIELHPIVAVRGAIPSRAWRRTRSGMLTTNFAESGGFIKSRPEEAAPDLQLHFVIGKLVDHGRKTVLGHGYSCHVCLLQPKSRGRVQLASSDPNALPLVDPNFLGEQDDMDRLVRGVRRMREILGQSALAKFGARESKASAGATSDAQIEQFIRNHADTIYHPVGSCRMGPGPLDVVDAELRVHGLQGLRVVDASIMPRVVSGNTNAPTIMIAEKAVDLLRNAA